MSALNSLPVVTLEYLWPFQRVTFRLVDIFQQEGYITCLLCHSQRFSHYCTTKAPQHQPRCKDVLVHIALELVVRHVEYVKLMLLVQNLNCKMRPIYLLWHRYMYLRQRLLCKPLLNFLARYLGTLIKFLYHISSI